MQVTITPVKQLVGEVKIPGDKSISHRGVMLGSLAKGTTRLSHFLMSEDCLNTIKAFQAMGIDIEIIGDSSEFIGDSSKLSEKSVNGDSSQIMQENISVIIHGKGLHGLKKPAKTIDSGNSGTTARLLAGILAGQAFEAVLDGDPSLRKRPMNRIITPLSQMGADIQSINDNVVDNAGSKANQGGTLPLSISGGNLKGIEYTLPVASAQVKSAIIFASLTADSPTIIHQPALSRDHTEIMLSHFGGRIETDQLTLTSYPISELYGKDLQIPGDISSAAFIITAALLVPGSRILMKDVGINPTRTGILEVFQQMGADIVIENQNDSQGEPTADILASYSDLRGTEISGNVIPRLIDEIPIIALAATQAQGTTIIRDAAELKVKESNRIDIVVRTLRAFGANIEATEDGMIIEGPTPLTGSTVTCEMDHRIAMMAAIAGLIAKGRTILTDGQWVDVSFPGFFHLLEKLT
ncbi:MAG: 3-phosphoshikimate 1-carboxyvinyltransferase [Clostridiales bacterium]|nr:3-phosphoshikimate 1-carboxyvinyltransferase [Clostridiales bacterium]